ncbi:MAG: ABC transporter ATP-binding protein [Planctomycetota bacterium]
MRALLHWLWRYRAWIAGGLLCLGIIDGMQTLVPFLLRAAIDDLSAGHADRLTLLAGGMLLIGVLMVGLRFFWRFLLFGAARRIRRDLRLALHAQLVRLDAGFRHGRSTGEQMALATSDIDAVNQACGFGMMAVFDAVFLILFSVAAMIHLSPALALITCLPLPLVALCEWRMGKVLYRCYDRSQTTFAVLTEQVREALVGVRTLKAHAREADCSRALERANQDNLQAWLRVSRIDSVFEPAIMFLAGVPAVVALLFGGRAVLDGTMSLGDFVAFVAVLSLLAWPMMAIGWSVNLWTRGAASMSRIQTVLDTVPAITSPTNAVRMPTDSGITLEAVSVRYPSAERDALRDLSVHIAAGGMLGIVGPTGSGKSTLADLLVRMNDPTHGVVRLGGCDLRTLVLNDLRRTVAIVPQEPFVFALSIAENLAFARPEASTAEIEAAAQAACLHEEILCLPQGYTTLLGERGITLSGGQRQRLAIARALLQDPAVLVLDDCLSALDAATETQVLANLRQARRGRTAVVISHRIRTIADANLTLVLDHGHVIERGTHAELLAVGGLYARLHALQQAEQALEERA